MKQKIRALLLAALMSLSLAACGSEPPPALTVESETTLKAVFLLPAARIPEMGWDEESFAHTIFLGGYQHPFPTTLSACGSLFTIADDSAFSFSDDGTVTGHLLFQGCYVGTVKLKNCISESKMYEGTVKSLTFTAPKTGDGNYYPSVYPISLNHVTIGSTAEDIAQDLGFAVSATGNIDISEKIGRYQIKLRGTAADGVTEITLTDAEA